MRVRVPLSCAIALVMLAVATPASAQHLYWRIAADSTGPYLSSLFVADAPDASNPQLLLNARPSRIRGIAVDSTAGEFFWVESDTGGPGFRIVRSTSSACSTIRSSLLEIRSPEVDPLGGKLYWVEIFGAGDGIYRANRDGSNVERVVDGPTSIISVDPVNGKLYWVDGNGIRRANLDGSNAEIVIFTEPGFAFWTIQVDPLDDKLYWIEDVEGFQWRLRRGNLDGSNDETLFVFPEATFYFQLDAANDKVYWLEDDTLIRADVDGTDREEFDPPVPVSLGFRFDGASEIVRVACGGTAVPASGPVSVALLLGALVAVAGRVIVRRRSS